MADEYGTGPHHHSAIQCCCGREECVFLKHSCSVLESVEQDVHAAAKMGQASRNLDPSPRGVNLLTRDAAGSPREARGLHGIG